MRAQDALVGASSRPLPASINRRGSNRSVSKKTRIPDFFSQGGKRGQSKSGPGIGGNRVGFVLAEVRS